MIGLMVPSVFASDHSVETPDHIKEEHAMNKERSSCLAKKHYVWEDGKCQPTEWWANKVKSWGIKQDLHSNKTYNIDGAKYDLNFMPVGETPEHVEENLNLVEFRKIQRYIEQKYEQKLQTMPLTENEYVALSEIVQNKWSKMESDCSNRYGTPDPSQLNYGFRSMDHQFAWNECIINAQTWHEQQQNSLFYERCCISESESKNLIKQYNREKNLAHAELETEYQAEIEAVVAQVEAEYNELREEEGLEPVSQKPQPSGGGCLIATAAFGSEMAPQVQFLRELRDNTVLQTQSGTTFMTGFNQFYYSFSPAVADLERENPVFKEAVKITLTPMLTSLTLLNYVEIDTEEEMLGYGIGIILLNVGMYFVAPAAIILQVKRWKSKN